MQKTEQKIQTVHTAFKKFSNVASYFMRVLWQVSKPLTIFLFILSLGSGLTLIAELWAMMSLINKLIEIDLSNTTVWRAMQTLLPWVLLFIGAMLIKHSIESYQPYLSKRLEENASALIKNHTFHKAMQLDLRSFETEAYYNQLENAKRAMNNQITMAIENVGFLIAGIVELLVVFVAISKSGLTFTALLIIGSIIMIVVATKASKQFVQVNYQQSPLKRQQSYWMGLSASRETAAELRLFGLGTYFLKKWKRLSDQLIDELYDARKRVAFLRIRGDLILVVLLAIMIIAIVSAGIKGTITMGALVAFLYMINRFEQAIYSVANNNEMLSEFYYKFQHIPVFLQSGKEEITSGDEAPVAMKEGIVFENVSFTYPGQSKPVLENIDLHITPGTRVALVGENGAGKSTLALLLLGLYEPTRGRIFVDGVDLTDITPAAWRHKTAAVFQNFVKYQLSARDNIAFGDIDTAEHTEKLKKSALLSGIDGVLSQLPFGYDTLLGKEYEEGKDLSGGEWQKVAIARAYFREAEILVLDEPTAALDAQSEYDVYKQFSQVSEGKTTLLISHRLGSARLADNIILLQSGKVLETGSHDKLIRQNGPYAAMYHGQAAWYQQEKGGQDGTFAKSK